MTETRELSVGDLVAAYRKIRGAIDQREEAHKAAVGELRSQMDTVSAAILKVCSEQDADSISTSHGTVTRRVAERYWTTDWESMYRFIREHDAPYLLEQRIHTGNVKQFLEENPEAFPAGLQCDRKYAITVRKPTKK